MCALGPASRFQPPGGSPGMARNLGKMVTFLGFRGGVEVTFSHNVERCQVMPSKKEKNIDIGQRLILFRKAQSLSGGQLAEGISRTRQTWSGYEAGAVEPPSAVLATLVKKYRLNMNWLLTGQGNMFLDESDTLAKAEVIPADCQRRIAELEEELKEERRLNRDLTRRLLEQNG